MGKSGGPGTCRCPARESPRRPFVRDDVLKGGEDGRRDIDRPKPVSGRLGAKGAIAAVGLESREIRGASEVRGPGAVAS
jgi:hypothetical protein